MRTSALLVIFVILSCLCRSQPAWAAALDPELQATLAGTGPQEEIPIIILLRGRLDPRPYASLPGKLRQRQLIRALQRKANAARKNLLPLLADQQARRVRSLWLINAVALAARPSLIAGLAAHPEVESIGLDAVITLVPEPDSAPAPPEWNIDAIGAPELWALGFTGQGVVMASMDTGVDLDHPDLRERWRGGGNSWYDPHGEHPLPFDANGHGTQVMGLMVGGVHGGSAIGVAPDAQWIAVKIFDDRGEAPLSMIHLGYQWLLDPDRDPLTADAPDIVNNSWGFAARPDECLLEFQPDIEMLRAAGIAVVFSAGNNGPAPSTSVSPANYPASFAAGATDVHDTIAFFSSRGPSPCAAAVFPAIAAPGVSVRTADLSSFAGIPNPDPYTTVSGTSFAASHVSGAMALLLSASPGATAAGLESALLQSAWDQGLPGADNDYGAGFIQVRQALSLMPDVNLCRGDLDGDGDGDGRDAAGFAAAGGGCADPAACPADLNGDGTVDGSDLPLFLADWGRTNCIP